ncbi:MAG: phosphoenolpyruvate--protein phosphotransferase [Phycisphaerae bacterium]|nr:phosphoenolpyruvate--protein phosphotransferase [Phycisphaerae bacterium]
MQTIKGIAVSPGIAIGEVFILDDQRRRIPRRSVGRAAVVHEHARLDAALNASISELSSVRERTRGELGEEAAKIFAFHLGMLADRSLTRPMHELVDREQVNAEYAVFSTMTALAERFAAMGDQAFKTKVDDVYDLSARVLKHLIGEHASKLADLDRRAIVLARDLTPSQAAAFNKSHVLGFVTEAGGKTGHTGIFARAMQIPAIVGAHGVVESCTEGTPAIIDGDQGSLILDPDEKTLQRYRRYEEQQRLFRLSMSELAKLPCVTLDGAEIELLGNIEFPEEIPSVVGGGGQGVGLYRTEYLYFTGDAEPTEEDHFAAYSKCVEMLGGRPLTIRTMDLGADKYTQEQADNPERNPMLGCRSLRYCLQNQPMFKRQLRAILRASALGPVRLMFPLVTTPDEFKRARFILNDVMEDLRDEHAKFDPRIKVGMMVEVPSAAICAETFAQHADFFSIGTNDLVQYVMAVDRTNDRVADMYNPANPAVTALIRSVAAAAKARNIPVSCCGESAGELEYTMLLIGLGVRTLSVSAAYLPALKRLIRSVSIEQCERVAEKAASIESDVAVSRYLRDVTRKIIPEAFDGRAVED